jgi:hypothetical protein
VGSENTVSVSAASAILELEAVDWALGRLRAQLGAQGARLRIGDAADADLLHIVLDEQTPVPDPSDTPERQAESFSLRAGDGDSVRSVRIDAGGERGFSYGISEVTDRIVAEGFEFRIDAGESYAPAVPVRGIQRAFSSAAEDIPWFHDRQFWAEYLDHLAAQRFNRFHLPFGMQYNYGTGYESRTATDDYLCFVYPFLLDVPGFSVRAEGVADDERDRNLEALAFIARETRRRGMSFQLGLWNHAYDYGWESKHHYPILGIGEDSHAEYSAAALAILLERIPEIEGLTFRVHHEGGIHEEGHEKFWDTVFEAASNAGRPLQIDMHAKGVDDALREAVRKPNLQPVISGKYWAEHTGLPYHQASIRERELQANIWGHHDRASLSGVTEGSRKFTRYGYADFLDEDRDIDFMFRMWPGTQKLLLWGDPAMAAGFGRHATIGGSKGLDFCEPLFFKGRKGTGGPGRRDPYVRDDLRLGIHDWKKYRYTYALWGQLLYDPDADPRVWRRVLDADHGDRAKHVEQGLSALSRVLPLVTVAHGVSGANNHYSPEMYVDLAISHWRQMTHYMFDTPSPHTWDGVSPFDPALFYSVGGYCQAVLDGAVDARYTPLEVAVWLEDMAATGQQAIEAIEAGDAPRNAQTERALIDMKVLTRLARFFAGKFRAAVAYGFFDRSRDAQHLQRAIELVERAHAEFAAIDADTAGAYQSDLAFGVGLSERGHWKDRGPAMREDLFLLKLELEKATAGDAAPSTGELELREGRPRAAAELDAAAAFTRGDAFVVRLRTSRPLDGATLHYRHLDQSKPIRTVEMTADADGYVAEIPAEYTETTFPLMYFADVRLPGEHPVFVPALDDDLSNQPYVVVHSTAAADR